MPRVADQIAPSQNAPATPSRPILKSPSPASAGDFASPSKHVRFEIPPAEKRLDGTPSQTAAKLIASKAHRRRRRNSQSNALFSPCANLAFRSPNKSATTPPSENSVRSSANVHDIYAATYDNISNVLGGTNPLSARRPLNFSPAESSMPHSSRAKRILAKATAEGAGIIIQRRLFPAVQKSGPQAGGGPLLSPSEKSGSSPFRLKSQTRDEMSASDNDFDDLILSSTCAVEEVGVVGAKFPSVADNPGVSCIVSSCDAKVQHPIEKNLTETVLSSVESDEIVNPSSPCDNTSQSGLTLDSVAASNSRHPEHRLSPVQESAMEDFDEVKPSSNSNELCTVVSDISGESQIAVDSSQPTVTFVVSPKLRCHDSSPLEIMRELTGRESINHSCRMDLNEMSLSNKLKSSDSAAETTAANSELVAPFTHTVGDADTPSQRLMIKEQTFSMVDDCNVLCSNHSTTSAGCCVATLSALENPKHFTNSHFMPVESELKIPSKPDDPRGNEVERIISLRIDESGDIYFRLRWSGFGPDHDTWEPESAITQGADVLLADFNRRSQRSVVCYVPAASTSTTRAIPYCSSMRIKHQSPIGNGHVRSRERLTSETLGKVVREFSLKRRRQNPLDSIDVDGNDIEKHSITAKPRLSDSFSEASSDLKYSPSVANSLSIKRPRTPLSSSRSRASRRLIRLNKGDVVSVMSGLSEELGDRFWLFQILEDYELDRHDSSTLLSGVYLRRVAKDPKSTLYAHSKKEFDSIYLDNTLKTSRGKVIRPHLAPEGYHNRYHRLGEASLHTIMAALDQL